MRRVATALLATGSVLLLAACGGGSHSANKATNAPTVTPTPSEAGAGSSVVPSNLPTTAAARGTILATIKNDGQVNVISNAQGQGFTAVHSITNSTLDDSYLQAYGIAGTRLAKISAGSFTGGCGAADVKVGDSRLLLAEKLTHQPTGDTLTLSAFDATSGKKVWTTTLVSNSQTGVGCSSTDGYLGSQATGLPTFTTTFDGRWGVYQPDDQYDLSHSVAIDLVTGKTYPKPNLYGTLGNWLTIAKVSATNDPPASLTLTTPGSWASLGTLTLGDHGMVQDVPGPYQLTLVTAGTQFPANDITNRTTAVITPDGKTLIGLQGSTAQGAPATTVAYSLPTMKQLWSIPASPTSSETVAGINNSIVVIVRQPFAVDSALQLVALNTQSAAQVWEQDTTSDSIVCDLTASQLVIVTADQLAFLGTGDGHQLTSVQNDTKDAYNNYACPKVIAGGVSGLGFVDLAAIAADAAAASASAVAATATSTATSANTPAPPPPTTDIGVGQLATP
jgi:hypothetical protein